MGLHSPKGSSGGEAHKTTGYVFRSSSSFLPTLKLRRPRLEELGWPASGITVKPFSNLHMRKRRRGPDLQGGRCPRDTRKMSTGGTARSKATAKILEDIGVLLRDTITACRRWPPRGVEPEATSTGCVSVVIKSDQGAVS